MRGQTVHKGDVLFRIDASDVENNIEQLQLNVQSAQLALNDLLKTQSDNQKDRNVKADDAGVITELHVDRGDSVTVGTVIADVLDRDHMKLKVPFPLRRCIGLRAWAGPRPVTVNGTAETVKRNGGVHRRHRRGGTRRHPGPPGDHLGQQPRRPV
ncbi:MAG: biotin/lipoyl-binding protein [Flavonifractor plautii]